MHLTYPEKGFVGAAPIVAATISLALGAALASKIRKDQRITVSFFGDGSTDEGVLYESLNFAALKKLPLLFVCENNFYSTHMPIRECRPNTDIFKIGQPFDILSMKVDGNNVIEVYEAAKKGIDSCKNNSGPALIECVTYRLRGHVGPDDNIQGTRTDIRPKEEVTEWKKRDPVMAFEQFLLTQNILSEEMIESIQRKAAQEVKEAHIYAKNSPYPKESELTHYVFKH